MRMENSLSGNFWGIENFRNTLKHHLDIAVWIKWGWMSHRSFHIRAMNLDAHVLGIWCGMMNKMSTAMLTWTLSLKIKIVSLAFRGFIVVVLSDHITVLSPSYLFFSSQLSWQYLKNVILYANRQQWTSILKMQFPPKWEMTALDGPVLGLLSTFLYTWHFIPVCY